MVTADLQMPPHLTAAPGAVATRKHHTAGEEQARAMAPGETTHKQYATSEYSNFFHPTHENYIILDSITCDQNYVCFEKAMQLFFQR